MNQRPESSLKRVTLFDSVLLCAFQCSKSEGGDQV